MPRNSAPQLRSQNDKGAANRVYYAVFNAIRAVLILKGVDFKKHSATLSYFREEYIKTGVFEEHYSDVISLASQFRTDSVYLDFYDIDKTEVNECIQDVSQIITAIEAHLNAKTG